MALTTSRRSGVRRRPPPGDGGNRGSNRVHWASVRSDGSGVRAGRSISANSPGSGGGEALGEPKELLRRPQIVQTLELSAPFLRLYWKITAPSHFYIIITYFDPHVW